MMVPLRLAGGIRDLNGVAPYPAPVHLALGFEFDAGGVRRGTHQLGLDAHSFDSESHPRVYTALHGVGVDRDGLVVFVELTRSEGL